MAATNNKQLKRQLTSAACTLLSALPVAAAGKFEGWEVDTSVLYYNESDNRVSAVEPVVKLRKDFGESRIADVKFTLDALTGATPNGATPSNVAQTFTRPSGNDTYVVPAGEIPLDDTFRDTRIAVNGSWQQPLNRLTLLNVGVNFSNEYDFRSLGGSIQLARDFNQKNTTVLFGLAREMDTIDPVGGVPTPFASMGSIGNVPRMGTSESKDVMDYLLGVTQVINRRTLMQLNYSMSQSDGYLVDPYKLLSQIDPNTGATLDVVHESRPDKRTKHSIYWLTRYHLKRDVVSAAYRYFTDDWGVKSHTVDLSYHWKFSDRKYLEPLVRFYRQTEADFYHINLISGQPLPAEASADYRLAQFNGYTFGCKYGWTLKNETTLTLRADYYTQLGDGSPSTAVGVQRGLDLYPDLKATIVRIQYSF